MPKVQDLTRFALAGNLKWLLLAGLAALALAMLYGSLRGAAGNIDRLLNWTRHPAQIVSTADEATLEVEIGEAAAAGIPGVQYHPYPTPYEPGNTRILLPRIAELSFASNGSTVLLQNPAAPAEVVLLAHLGMWIHVLVKLVVAAVIAGLGYWLLLQGWGEDLSWSNGGWVPTDSIGTAAGARADPQSAIREPDGSRYMPLFWVALFGGLMASAFWGAPPHWPAWAPLVFLALATPCALAAITAIESWTRQVGHDEAGLCDITFFGAKRVPWSAIAAVRRENINAESQASHDRASKRSGSRPQSIWVHRLMDADDRQILSLDDTLVPKERFAVLLERADGHGAVTSRIAPAWVADAMDAAAEPGDDDDEGMDPAIAAQMEQARTEFATMSAKHDRTMRFGWLLVCSPFILFTLWLGWKAVYFRFLAERVDGTVIAREDAGLPFLTVEYRDASGATHTIESDGQAENERYAVGDRLRVFYHADAPQNARLDLFLEMWLGTLISAGITLLVMIPLLLMR